MVSRIRYDGLGSAFFNFWKNYMRRFKDTDLFEQIFAKILEDCMKYKLVDTEHIFVDSTHVKACANSKKMRKRVAHEQALWYEEKLQKEITKDREAHEKKPLKEKDKNDPPSGGGSDDRTTEKKSQRGQKLRNVVPVIRKAAIAHELLEDGSEPLFPYKRPMTEDSFFRKYEYVYDEYYDCYLCPEKVDSHLTAVGK